METTILQIPIYTRVCASLRSVLFSCSVNWHILLWHELRILVCQSLRSAVFPCSRNWHILHWHERPCLSCPAVCMHMLLLTEASVDTSVSVNLSHTLASVVKLAHCGNPGPQSHRILLSLFSCTCQVWDHAIMTQKPQEAHHNSADEARQNKYREPGPKGASTSMGKREQRHKIICSSQVLI